MTDRFQQMRHAAKVREILAPKHKSRWLSIGQHDCSIHDQPPRTSGELKVGLGSADSGGETTSLERFEQNPVGTLAQIIHPKSASLFTNHRARRVRKSTTPKNIAPEFTRQQAQRQKEIKEIRPKEKDPFPPNFLN